MSSTYTDEDLFMHYRPYADSAETALRVVAEHRALYPLPDPVRGGDWAGTTPAERKEGTFQALERAAAMEDGPERQALIDHALGGARVREAAPAKVGR